MHISSVVTNVLFCFSCILGDPAWIKKKEMLVKRSYAADTQIPVLCWLWDWSTVLLRYTIRQREAVSTFWRTPTPSRTGCQLLVSDTNQCCMTPGHRTSWSPRHSAKSNGRPSVSCVHRDSSPLHPTGAAVCGLGQHCTILGYPPSPCPKEDLRSPRLRRGGRHR